MKLLLAQFDDGTFGYQHIDRDKKIVNKQSLFEDREDFFERIGHRPRNNEYGAIEFLDNKIIDGSVTERVDVAMGGYGLSKLINDESWFVRKEVAKQGYGLDILSEDENPEVRLNVAYLGYKLDTFVKDPDPMVRRGVAEVALKYGRKDLLNILINDKDLNVVNYANKFLYNL